MQRLLCAAVKWLSEHLVVRTKDDQDRSDKMHYDDVPPKPSTEIGIKIEF